MALFFVTGVSGAGKSSLVHELRSQNFEAYDTDDDGFSKWHNEETGYVHPKSSVKAHQRTPEFLKFHTWKIPREEVEELARQAGSKTIFLCGVANNEDQLQDLFAARFALVIDDQTLKHRLLTRTTNDWGKQPHELQQSLDSQKAIKEAYKTSGHILINATQSSDMVVDEILQYVKQFDES